VAAVDLVIGRLSGVHVDCLRFAFDALSPGTILERAQLRIEEAQAVCCCRDCGAARPVHELVVQCVCCGSWNIVIEGGQDLLLQSIELAAVP
jgi:hydrogenase nickel incorporation protein HypA/HybF